MYRIRKWLGWDQEPQQQPLITPVEQKAEEMPTPFAESKSTPAASCGRNTLKALSFTAIVVDLIFAVFLFGANREAVQYILSESGIENGFLEFCLVFLGGILTGMSTFADATIINPVEDVEDLISLQATSIDAKLVESSRCEQRSVKTFALFNQVVSSVPNVIGSAADALGFAYLTENTTARWITGIPTTALGVFFYILLTRVRINDHSYEFIHKVFFNWKESMLVNALKSPAKSLEVVIQTLSSALYRGVSIGYIVRQLLLTMFERKEDEPSNSYYIFLGGAATLYIALFSRTLNVYKEIFNDKFQLVTPEILSKTKVSKGGVAIDITMTALRAASAAALVSRHGAESKALNYISSGLIFGFFAVHGVYVRYNTRLYQTALGEMEEERLLSSAQENKSIQDGAAEIFNYIKEKKKTSGLKRIVTIANAGGRVGRSVAFFAFLYSLNQTLEKAGLGLNLKFIDILCLHQLWGNSTFENDASFYQETLVNNWAYYRAKMEICDTKCLGKRCLSMLWRSSKDYNPEYLENIKARLIEECKKEKGSRDVQNFSTSLDEKNFFGREKIPLIIRKIDQTSC